MSNEIEKKIAEAQLKGLGLDVGKPEPKPASTNTSRAPYNGSWAKNGGYQRRLPMGDAPSMTSTLMRGGDDTPFVVEKRNVSTPKGVSGKEVSPSKHVKPVVPDEVIKDCVSTAEKMIRRVAEAGGGVKCRENYAEITTPIYDELTEAMYTAIGNLLDAADLTVSTGGRIRLKAALRNVVLETIRVDGGTIYPIRVVDPRD